LLALIGDFLLACEQAAANDKFVFLFSACITVTSAFTSDIFDFLRERWASDDDGYARMMMLLMVVEQIDDSTKININKWSKVILLSAISCKSILNYFASERQYEKHFVLLEKAELQHAKKLLHSIAL